MYPLRIYRSLIIMEPNPNIPAFPSSVLPADAVPVDAAAAFCCITVSTIRRKIRAGTLTPYRDGTRLLVRLGELVIPYEPRAFR